MAVSFYMDVHVPAAITEGLQRREVDVVTSQEDGTRRASDEELLTRAMELGRVLFSQDEDLLVLAAHRQTAGLEFSGLVFGPQGGASPGQVHRRLGADCQVL
jgi:hypothetical protein